MWGGLPLNPKDRARGPRRLGADPCPDGCPIPAHANARRPSQWCMTARNPVGVMAACGRVCAAPAPLQAECAPSVSHGRALRARVITCIR